MQWSVSFSIYRRSKQCERAIKQTLIVAKEFNVIRLSFRTWYVIISIPSLINVFHTFFFFNFFSSFILFPFYNT